MSKTSVFAISIAHNSSCFQQDSRHFLKCIVFIDMPTTGVLTTSIA